MASLQLFRGCIALVGPDVDALASRISIPEHYSFSSSTIPPHITVISKNELRSLVPVRAPERALKQLQDWTQAEKLSLHAVGLGGYPPSRPEVFFAVIVWAKGQQLRKQFGLPPKHFHVTLSQQDAHDIDKGVNSLLEELPLDASPELLDHLAFTLYSMGDHIRAKEFAEQLCCSVPHGEKGFLRLGDAAIRLAQYKLAMLAYGRAYDTCLANHKVETYCLRQLSTCAKETEWGSVCTEWELEQIPTDLYKVLMRPWSKELRLRILDEQSEASSLCLLPRDQLFIPPLTTRPTSSPAYRLPRFFRWLIPFRIALMSTPRNELDIAALGSDHLRIRSVLTLTEETPLPQNWFSDSSVTNTFCPIPNYHPPTIC